jgi:sugar/nucleoside kinase (ribokinase family)
MEPPSSLWGCNLTRFRSAWEDRGVDVVCLGILVADVICRPVDELPERGTLGLVGQVELRGGGCALNTASALARLGVRAGVAGKVGTDRFGDFVLDLLDERAVDRRGVVRDVSTPTSATVALVGSDGTRTFLHVPGANGTLRADELDAELLYPGRALHAAGQLVMPELDGEPFARLLAEARGRGLVTSLDTVFDATGRWERVLPSLPHVDLFTPALAEARGITGEDDPERAAARLLEHGVGAVAVTLGPDGCYASGPGFEGHVQAPRVAEVDGTGSGDAFAAGLLYGTLADWGFERSVRFACAAGALATTAVGAYAGLRGPDETLELAGLA